MGLKDIFRRKPAKPDPADSPSDTAVRNAEDATLMLEDANFASGDAATVAIQSPIADPSERAGDDTTERLVPQDVAATVAVSIPSFDEESGGTDATAPAAEPTVTPQVRDVGTETVAMTDLSTGAEATVAISIPDLDSSDEPEGVDTQRMRSPDSDTARSKALATEPPSGRGMSATMAIPDFKIEAERASRAADDATVAVPIPNFEEASDETTPSPDATVAVAIPNFDEATLESSASVDATVAVPVVDLDDGGAGSTGKLQVPAPPDATVAVAIPDFEEATLESSAPIGATVAVPIPNFDKAREESGVDLEAAQPEVELEAQSEPEPDSNDDTRFDLPNADSLRPVVVAVLVGVAGELAGKVCPISEGETKLGRSDSCDVVLSSMKISREHSTIVHQDDVFAILPLSDKNPTYVNGDVISGCELSDGDSIRLGSTTFRFRTIQGL